MAAELTNEEKLAAARARRTKLAAEREQKNAAKVLESALAAEEQGIVDDEAIAKIDDEHGPEGREFKVLRTDLGAVVVKRAPGPAFKKFQDLKARPNHKETELCEQLARPCVIHPSKERFDEMLREQPYIATRCADAIAVLAGVRAEEVSEKS